jgi:hypothetical protein
MVKPYKYNIPDFLARRPQLQLSAVYSSTPDLDFIILDIFLETPPLEI